MRWLCVALLVCSSLALADEPPPPPPGRLLFVRGDALLSLPGDGKGEPTEIIKLPDTIGTAQSLAATADGGLVVLQGDKGAAWLIAGETAWRTGCDGHARPSPTAECVLCDAGGKLSIIGVSKAFRIDVAGSWPGADFLGGPRELAALADAGVLAFSPKKTFEPRVAAQAGPTSHLLVAPDGSKAAAVFGTGDSARVKGFVLDGTGVPRQLGGPGFPAVWSWDSVWLMIQEGRAPTDSMDPGGDGDGDGDGDESGGESGAITPPPAADPWLLAAPNKKKTDSKKKKKEPKKPEPPTKVRTCVVRAVGGESKCWNHYEPRSFSPTNDLVLLWREGNLYAGKIAGVNPESPHRLVEKADGPAVWVR